MSGSATEKRLAIAQARADAARARLSITIAALQERARPTSLVHDVTATLKGRGTAMALAVVDTAKRKPARTGAIVAVIGLFFARRPLSRLVRRATATFAGPPHAPEKGPRL